MHIQAKNLTKSYEPHKTILNKVNVEVFEGEKIAIQGVSGGGKSTLLNLLGLLDHPDAGNLLLNGQDALAWNLHQKAQFRSKNIGFIFQNYALLENRSVWENVALAPLYQGDGLWEAKKKALDCLTQLNMCEWADQRVSQLSGGQKQRVCVARALINCPSLILADEPTGALDPQTRDTVWEMLNSAQKMWNASIILVSHDSVLCTRCDKQWSMSGGELCVVG